MSLPRSLWRDALICVSFFTRLPVPHFDMEGRSLASAFWAAPIAGLPVAAAGGAVFALAHALYLPAGSAAALALAATLAVTGCLHEDGLSDTVDGFGGGKTRERKLEIMRDSRIGAYGASAIVTSLLLRWSALDAIAKPGKVFAALIAAHCASRALMPLWLSMLPPARSDGLSASAGRSDPRPVLVALLFGLLALTALQPFGIAVAVALLCATLLAFRALCLAQIGGQTGDNAGALQQAAEILILLTAAALTRTV